MSNKVEIQVAVTGQEAAKAQLAALTAAPGSAATTPAAAATAATAAAAVSTATTTRQTVVLSNQLIDASQKYGVLESAAIDSSQKQIAALSGVSESLSALEKAQMDQAGVSASSWDKWSSIQANAKSGLSGLIEELEKGTKASGTFWGTFSGMFAHRAASEGINILGSEVAQLVDQLDKNNQAENFGLDQQTYEYQKRFKDDIRSRQKSEIAGWKPEDEKSIAAQVAEEWDGSGKRYDKNSLVDEIKARTKAKEEADQKSAALSDLQKRMDAEFVKGGNSEEYQRLSKLYTSADQGQLASKYQGKNLSDQVSLEDTRTQAAAEKLKKADEEMAAFFDSVAEGAKKLAAVKDDLQWSQKLAGQSGDKQAAAMFAAEQKALADGTLSKLGGGDVSKGLSRFRDEEKLAMQANDTKTMQLQRPGSMLRGSQEAFTDQLGPVRQDPVRATENLSRVMENLKVSIDRALQGGNIQIIGRSA